MTFGKRGGVIYDRIQDPDLSDEGKRAAPRGGMYFLSNGGIGSTL